MHNYTTVRVQNRVKNVFAVAITTVASLLTLIGFTPLKAVCESRWVNWRQAQTVSSFHRNQEVYAGIVAKAKILHTSGVEIFYLNPRFEPESLSRSRVSSVQGEVGRVRISGSRAGECEVSILARDDGRFGRVEFLYREYPVKRLVGDECDISLAKNWTACRSKSD